MKSMQHILLAGATGLGFVASANAAGLLIADGGLGGVLKIKDHDVRVTVNNGVVVTTVDQVFHNTENRQVEALYTFPVPRGASVSNFSMWINGKEMVGEVVEKKRAREIYESYKAPRRDPGLLEQVDYRTFEMRVFPIAANADQRVQVTYYQELDFDHNQATYVYPLSTNTRPGINARTTGRFSLALDAKSEIPITSLASASHADDFAVVKHSDNYQQASLETRGGDLSRDVVLTFDMQRAKTGLDLIASRPKDEDGYFSLTLTAGEELAKIDKPMDYVFVLDVSGSMNQEQKLQLSQRSLGAFVQTLGEKDRFEVITFNVQAQTLFNQITPADDASKARAIEFLNAQQPRGGTRLNPAITTAYKYADPARPLNVIVLSDGMSEQSERAELIQLIKSRPAETRVFAIGIGNDVNRAMLEQISSESGGMAAFLSREDNVERQAQALRRKLVRPAATDVAIKIDGVDAYDVLPAQLTNLYYGAPVRVYGRYRGSGDAKVTVTGNISGTPITQTVEMGFPQVDDDNPEIERMWAMKKIDGLLKNADAIGSRNSVADEIVRLGEGYSIVTEYTSFLVLENDGEYQRWKIDRRNATRIARDRAAQERVAQQLQQIRDASADQLGPAALDAKPAAKQIAMNTPTPQASSPQNAPPPTRDTPRNRDFNLPTGGGGAIDPFAAVLIVVVAAGAWGFRRRSSNPN